MEILKELWQMPMLWNLVIPVAAVLLFVAFLVWDSGHLPMERKIMNRLRKNRRAHHRGAHHT